MFVEQSLCLQNNLYDCRKISKIQNTLYDCRTISMFVVRSLCLNLLQSLCLCYALYDCTTISMCSPTLVFMSSTCVAKTRCKPMRQSWQSTISQIVLGRTRSSFVRRFIVKKIIKSNNRSLQFILRTDAQKSFDRSADPVVHLLLLKCSMIYVAFSCLLV